MGVLYNVLFKPIGRGDGSMTATANGPAADIGGPPSQPAVAVAVNGDGDGDKSQPDWTLDRRDDGSLVWRRHDDGPSPVSPSRRRVEFLDAVQVRVFERDDYSWCDDDDDDDDDDGQTCCNAGEWSSYGDCVADGTKRLRRGDQEDYPVLVAVSVTVLGLCIGLAYMFAPVRWLLHQLLVDD